MLDLNLIKNEFVSYAANHYTTELTHKNRLNNIANHVFSHISGRLANTLQTEIKPLVQSLLYGNEFSWYVVDNERYVRYIREEKGDNSYTIRSLLHYNIKEVDLEKIVWASVEQALDNAMVQSDDPVLDKALLENKHPNSPLTLHQFARSHFTHSICDHIKALSIPEFDDFKIIEKQRVGQEALMTRILATPQCIVHVFMNEQLGAHMSLALSENPCVDQITQLKEWLEKDAIIIVDTPLPMSTHKNKTFYTREGHMNIHGVICHLNKKYVKQVYNYDFSSGKIANNVLFKE
jgi:hypothetical protein